MVEAGQFQKTDSAEANDPNRKQEFIDHLEQNGYRDLVK